MNMPGMGGWRPAARCGRTSEVAIIMLTVRNPRSDKVAALDAGADDYVTKPFSIAGTAGAHPRGAAADAAHGGRGATQLSREDVEINLATRRVRLRVREVRLTPKEFDLLHYSREPERADPARQAAAGGVGTGLRQRGRISACVHQSAPQEDRAGSASPLPGDGALGGISL